MKKRHLLGIWLVLMGSGAVAQEPPTPEVTEHHKELAKEVGTWEGSMKMWMAPGPDPMESPVLETNTLMDGGLWIVTNFEAGPFKGMGITGYDTAKEKYIGNWVDNMSTYMSVMRGKKNKDGDLQMHMIGRNPMTGEDEKMKSVSKRVSDDEKVMTMFKAGDGEGEWIKQFEIVVKRKT
jgi:hypothetical protein